MTPSLRGSLQKITEDVMLVTRCLAQGRPRSSRLSRTRSSPALSTQYSLEIARELTEAHHEDLEQEEGEEDEDDEEEEVSAASEQTVKTQRSLEVHPFIQNILKKEESIEICKVLTEALQEDIEEEERLEELRESKMTFRNSLKKITDDILTVTKLLGNNPNIAQPALATKESLEISKELTKAHQDDQKESIEISEELIEAHQGDIKQSIEISEELRKAHQEDLEEEEAEDTSFLERMRLKTPEKRPDESVSLSSVDIKVSPINRNVVCNGLVQAEILRMTGELVRVTRILGAVRGQRSPQQLPATLHPADQYQQAGIDAMSCTTLEASPTR